MGDATSDDSMPCDAACQGACRTLAAAVRSMPDIQLVLDMAASPPEPAAKPCGSAKKRRRGAAGAPARLLTVLAECCYYGRGG